MNELVLTNFNGVDAIDSRQVAEAVEKEHKNLMRDIKNYCDNLNEAKIKTVDFFIESSYVDNKGETRPCYLCTKKGCEMILNLLSGGISIIFQALCLNAFDKELSLKEKLQKLNYARTLCSDTKQYVYVMEREIGGVKIGIAKDVESRKSILEHAGGFDFSQVKIYGAFDNAREIENNAHKSLSKHRMNGEYFDVSFETACRAVEIIISNYT